MRTLEPYGDFAQGDKRDSGGRARTTRVIFAEVALDTADFALRRDRHEFTVCYYTWDDVVLATSLTVQSECASRGIQLFGKARRLRNKRSIKGTALWCRVHAAASA